MDLQSLMDLVLDGDDDSMVDVVVDEYLWLE